MLFALGVLLFALGLLASIALHEVGHLVPAKRSGVKVTQYMVGFGPTLWSRRRGETEYGVKAVPLGGYIRMIGMFPPRPGSHPGEDETHLRPSSTGWMRAMVEDARAAELQHVGPQDADRVFYRQPVRRKLLIMLGGPSTNLLIGLVLLSGLLLGYGVPRPTTTVDTVSECVVPASSASSTCPAGAPTSPAAAAGVRPGDRIVAFDGIPIGSWEQLQGLIRDAGDRTVTLTVDRGGSRQDLRAALIRTERRADPTDPRSTALVTVGFLGVGPGYATTRLSPAELPAQLWSYVEQTGAAVVKVPQRMVGVWHAAFGGGQREVDGPIGIVGVSRLGGEVAALPDVPLGAKAVQLVGLLASLNLALFVFNLIPLLPLDGGHVAGALYEGARRAVARVRGRPDPGPADVAKMLPVAYAVSVVLITMSALLLYADLVNPVRFPQ